MSLHLDLDTLARTIYGEARGEPFEGQLAVGWVILNRVQRGGRFGTTIDAVCKRPLQFSCWNADDPTYPAMISANIEQPRFLNCFGAACLVIGRKFPDPTAGADHYHTIAQPVWAKHWPPNWAARCRETARIGAHVFLREIV